MILPLLVVIDFPPRIDVYATLPSMQMIFGDKSKICLWRYGRHAMRSSCSGTLLPGGLHFTTFVMKTFDLSSPAFFIASSKIRPAAPTKGLPFRSSFFPGASPMNINLADTCPSPGTALFLVLESLQSGHPTTSLAIFSRESLFILIPCHLEAHSSLFILPSSNQ